MKDWHRLVTYPTMPNANFSSQESISSDSLQDPFQSVLALCFRSHQHRHGILIPHSATGVALYFVSTPYMDSTHHILSIANLVPIRALLIVAGEFSALDIDSITIDLREARTQLRYWKSSDAAPRAVWYATQFLRINFATQDTLILDNPWYIYLSALICWAYDYQGLDHPKTPWLTNHTYTSLETEAFMWQYLDGMNVPSWQDIAAAPIGRSTKNLLEAVRARISVNTVSGLLRDASVVLSRLVGE